MLNRTVSSGSPDPVVWSAGRSGAPDDQWDDGEAGASQWEASLGCSRPVAGTWRGAGRMHRSLSHNTARDTRVICGGGIVTTASDSLVHWATLQEIQLLFPVAGALMHRKSLHRTEDR